MSRLLFVKDSQQFPRSSGHDVHTYFMMKSLASLGHEVHLLTKSPASDEAVDGAGLAGVYCFAELPDEPARLVDKTYLQRRFCSYWGIDSENINQVGALADSIDCDAVVVVGLDVLPYLFAVDGKKRVWYAADEWLYHHLTLVFPHRPNSWRNIKSGLVKGLYEFAFRNIVDRVWVVSKADAKAARIVMANVSADVIPNGVDTSHFQRQTAANPIAKSCTFWGRLDFEPNIDAIRWFAQNVWSSLKAKSPEAQFNVFGFQPVPEVLELAKRYDFSVIPDMPDLRREIANHDLVVLPMVSGAGIKNKFLEAAAMGKPIVVSQRALNGITVPEDLPVKIARGPSDWSRAIERLWNDASEKERLGCLARDWVVNDYSWEKAARLAEESLNIS